MSLKIKTNAQVKKHNKSNISKSYENREFAQYYWIAGCKNYNNLKVMLLKIHKSNLLSNENDK